MRSRRENQLGDCRDTQAGGESGLDKGGGVEMEGDGRFWTDLGSRANRTCWAVWEAENPQGIKSGSWRR